MVSQHAVQQVSGGGIPACLAGFQAHTQGEVEGSGWGGSPGPHPRGKLRGLAWWGLQAHTQGGLQGHTQGGVSQLALRQTLECILVPYCIRLQYHAWNIQ